MAFINGFAQTSEERLLIKSMYDMTKIEQLKSNFKTEYQERENRVIGFLRGSNTKRTSIIKGKSFFIYDVVNGKPMYLCSDNIDAARATKTNSLLPNGSLGLNLEGENMIVGVWDFESARASHVEFTDDQIIPQSRITFSDLSGTVIDGHATRVAATIIAKGVDPDAKGMAPKARVNSYDWDRNEEEILDESSNGLLLSNHSYGFPIFRQDGSQQKSAEEIGNYSNISRAWDLITYNAPYHLPVTSAGNEGLENYSGGLATGYDKLTDYSTSKNSLVVASANVLFNGSTGDIQFFTRSDFSSQGPTDDFRIKPDIAGKGEDVFSATSSSDTAYNTQNGTSFSAPNVTGSIVLLQEYYNLLNSVYMRAATARGLVCHTALDDNVKAGPDPFLGWGLLDAEKAANVIKGDKDGTAIIIEGILNEGDTYTYTFSASGGSELKASICWTDPAGIVSLSPNNVLSPRLVNDLDLRLTDVNNTIYTPWKLDNTNITGLAIKGDNNVDNIERIDVLNPLDGNYTLTVTHKGSLTNGSQAFSLILTGNNLTLNTQENKLSGLSIWPIPASDRINIDYKRFPNNAEIALYDMHGGLVHKDVLTKVSKEKYSVNTSKFSSGIYFLSITSDNSKITKKIIIK